MPYRVPAVESAVRILRYLQDNQDLRCAVSEVTRALGLNKSTCHCILKTLENDGLVVCDRLTKGYSLGPALISLGATAARRADHVAVALPFVQQLVVEVQFACLMAQLLPDGQIVVVDKVESRKEIKVTAAVGERFPITAAALGKSFLAWMPQPQAEDLLSRTGMARFTPQSITDITAFWHELERVRELGYSVSRGEYYQHNNAIGTPIFGPDGQTVLVLCILGFSSDLTEDLIPLYGVKLRNTALAITTAIGGCIPANFPRESPHMTKMKTD